MTRRRSTTPCAALAGLLFTAGTGELAAQEAGRGSVGLDLTVGLTVRPMLHLRRTTEPVVLEDRDGLLTVGLDVDVAANQAWSLQLLRGAAGADAPALEVRDATGHWVPLNDARRLITVVADHAPCNYTRIRLVVRFAGPATPDAIRTLGALTLDLSPSER